MGGMDGTSIDGGIMFGIGIDLVILPDQGD